MAGQRGVYKAGRDKSSLQSEFWWTALQSAVTLRTASPLCLSFGRGKNSLVAGCFDFLIFSLNPNICLWIFIIHATILSIGNLKAYPHSETLPPTKPYHSNKVTPTIIATPYEVMGVNYFQIAITTY